MKYPGNSCKIAKILFSRGIAMVKHDLAKEIHEKAALSLTEATQALEQVLTILKETLAEGETVKLSGFGTFLVKKRAERKGRNLTTGEAIPVQAKWVVKFEPSVQLKAMVNEKGGI
jgi:integration host factor subunit alpha